MEISPLFSLFVIPIIYAVYSLFTIKYRMIKNEILVVIRRMYYSLWLIIIVLVINSIDIDKLKVDNMFGIPQLIWVIFSIFVVGMITAIILDILIISGNDIKEISFGFAKLSRGEIKENIEEQRNNIDNLVNLIESEYKTIQNIEEYIRNRKIEELIITDFEHFSYFDELISIVTYFYDLLNISKTVSYITLNDNVIETTLKEKYRIIDKKIDLVIHEVNHNNSCIIKQYSSYLLFIPYYLFTNDKIVIIIESNKVTYELEQRFILNILKIYENYIIDLIYELHQQ